MPILVILCLIVTIIFDISFYNKPHLLDIYSYIKINALTKIMALLVIILFLL